jgi:uncharacterized protein (DUF1800 family)
MNDPNPSRWSKSSLHGRLILSLQALSLVTSACAAPVLVWQLGEDEDPLSNNYNPGNEFGYVTYATNPAPGLVTRLPGDPLYPGPGANPTQDDHFYFAGTYPAGFNGLTTALSVPTSEPTSSFEGRLLSVDASRFIHFPLTAAQASATSQLRLSFELIEGQVYVDTGNGGSFAENFGLHDITVRLRTATTNTILFQRTGVNRATQFSIAFPASSVGAVAGANTIEITRSGPAVAVPVASTGISFDYVKLEADQDALADSDGDGLPRWWETDHLLSDSNPSDAALDVDGDTLTALLEYNGGVASSDPHQRDSDGDGAADAAERTAGSDPTRVDSDADGLSDGNELTMAPFSSPLLTDSDGDGFPDAWEKRVGSNPNENASRPTAFANAIGFHFVSTEDIRGLISGITPAGAVPQLNWNNTVPLRNYDRMTGTTTDIGSPRVGMISNAAGQEVPNMTLQWSGAGTTTTSNDGSADQKLFNGLNYSNEAYNGNPKIPATLSLQGIPYASYHVFVYVGAPYDNQKCQVVLDNDPATKRLFSTTSAPPQRSLEKILSTTARPYGRGNYVQYMNRSGATLNISVTGANPDGDTYVVGLHGVQIIDASLNSSDGDSSGIPDWYEMQQALQPVTSATAAADPDGDGLTNLQEYQRLSDPNKADTDGDGLADGAESAGNALSLDSDGDGLSDFEETTGVFPSNPNVADTDGDGLSDKIEKSLGRDPAVALAPALPVYNAGANPQTWEWKIDSLQIVWDHHVGAIGGDAYYDDRLFSYFFRNVTDYSDNSLDLQLLMREGRLTYQFNSNASRGFSSSGNPAGYIYMIDPVYPPVDLTAALGFSGVGSHDISDRLQLRVLATRNTGNNWTVRFELNNLTRGTNVVTQEVLNSTAAPAINDGTFAWQTDPAQPNLPRSEVHRGVRLFLTTTPLESTAAFSAYADNDNDGLPNVWETANTLDLNSAADAATDADGDGLNNRAEFFAGTNPRNVDTDGDGANDAIEVAEASNPKVASLKPPFSSGVPVSGTDFNQNGLPDAWEAIYQTSGLQSGADTDGDGASNGTEAFWGTNPFDRQSNIALNFSRDGSDVVLTWTRADWKRQIVHRSTNMESWSPLALSPTAQGANNVARITGQLANPNGRAFYQATTQDQDTDLDGVSDWDEVRLTNSNPNAGDSVRRSSVSMAANGQVLSTVPGDYAAFASRLRNALPGGNPAAQITPEQAARFLQQSSFGPTMMEIERVQALGYSGWIQDQINVQPVTLQRPYIEFIQRDLRGAQLDETYLRANADDVGGENTSSAFARGAISGPDQLRQRVAFALSQILVASRRDPNLTERALGMADYYDIFLRHSFGNYRDVLQEVSLHPVMGRYLSHVGNQKARPEINQYPDENYARELMQLFTIGLWELNPNGTRKQGPDGKPIPTYDNGDITPMAAVFTGLWFGGKRWAYGGYENPDYAHPMQMWAEKHDFSAKQMLGTLSIPARPVSVENGLRDINDALDFLMRHPNTAPFISKQLIQFLVTSNPTPAYVQRIAAVFTDNGSGRRGDLGAVVPAILLDVEARDARWSVGSRSYGRLKEPVYRAMALARLGRLARFPGVNWWDYGDFYENSLQSPGLSPSVFNFFRPEYRPPGLLTANQLAAPALQITNSFTSLALANKLWSLAVNGLSHYSNYQWVPDYRDFLTLASNPPALVDQVNLLVCGSAMTATTRTVILNALNQPGAVTDPLLRAQLAVYLATVSPEGAIQR